MERSGNFYNARHLGYILISILIGCMAYNSLYDWQEIEALELGNKKIDELRKEINNINIPSNPQPPSKNEIELKEKEATQKKRLKEVKIATRRHKIPLPHNAT